MRSRALSEAPFQAEDDALAALAARAKAHARVVEMRPIEDVARLDADVNVYVEYGQSNRSGSEAWPPLTTKPTPGVYSLGETVRSSALDRYAPVGEARFNPLVGQVTRTNGSAFTAQEMADFAPGMQWEGESPGVAAVSRLRELAFAGAGGMAEAAPDLVLGNLSRGGRSMAELKKGHTVGDVEWYARYPDFIRQTRQAAEAQFRTHQVLGVGYTQGETEALRTETATARTREAFKAQFLNDVLAPIREDALANGNVRPPGVFLWQVGGHFTTDEDGEGRTDLFVAMALWEIARQTPGVWMVGPNYPLPHKDYSPGGKRRHLDPNGVRWAGAKEAQVLDRVINQRRHWEPLAPLAVVQSAPQTLDILFHVPAPPLRWGSIWSKGEILACVDRGFRVDDAAGQLPLAAPPQIVSDAVVRLELKRPVRGAARVWYGSKQRQGAGELCDSDANDPGLSYVFAPGMAPEADIPELVGKPYDMANWCIQFMLPVGWERPQEG